MSNARTIVLTALADLSSGDITAVDRWLAPGYIQHHPAIPDGPEGVRAMMATLGAPIRHDVHRVITDGDTVAVHGTYYGIGPAPMVSFDVLRVDADGKLAEHWDAQQPKSDQTVSGRTETDGPTEVTDLDRTEANRKLVTTFVEGILLGGAGNVTDYLSTAEYHQHNPYIADGLDGLAAGLATLAEQGRTASYTTLHKVIAEGNFVLTMAEGTFGATRTAFYDLFRLRDGKIVEHWDVLFDIPATLAHHNGIF